MSLSDDRVPGGGVGRKVTIDAVPGVRNPGTSSEYMVTRDESNGVLLDSGTGLQAISGGAPAHLISVYITVALTGTLTIGGMLNVTGTLTDFVLPIGSIGKILFDAGRIETALTAQKSSASDDGNIAMNWGTL